MAITVSKKIELYLKEKGVKKIWLANQLGISRQLLSRKLTDNFFEQNEISILRKIGIL